MEGGQEVARKRDEKGSGCGFDGDWVWHQLPGMGGWSNKLNICLSNKLILCFYNQHQ